MLGNDGKIIGIAVSDFTKIVGNKGFTDYYIIVECSTFKGKVAYIQVMFSSKMKGIDFNEPICGQAVIVRVTIHSYKSKGIWVTRISGRDLRIFNNPKRQKIDSSTIYVNENDEEEEID